MLRRSRDGDETAIVSESSSYQRMILTNIEGSKVGEGTSRSSCSALDHKFIWHPVAFLAALWRQSLTATSDKKTKTKILWCQGSFALLQCFPTWLARLLQIGQVRNMARIEAPAGHYMGRVSESEYMGKGVWKGGKTSDKSKTWSLINQPDRIPNSYSYCCYCYSVTKTVTWWYLGNQAWYHRSADVKTTGIFYK